MLVVNLITADRALRSVIGNCLIVFHPAGAAESASVLSLIERTQLVNRRVSVSRGIVLCNIGMEMDLFLLSKSSILDQMSLR